MEYASFQFKLRAMKALKGNWQTALLVTFFSGILMLALSIVQSLYIPDLTMYWTVNGTLEFEAYRAAVLAVPSWVWTLTSVLGIVSFLVSPMLAQGCNHYFVSRLQGRELGMQGLWSRVNQWGKALWLYVMIGVRIFLWSLLLVVPGIIAAFRYSMASYYLAENPEISAAEAIERSKQAMNGHKMHYFMLQFSFIGWSLMVMVVQMLLLGMGFVIAFVVAQFLSLFVSAYINGASAAFYLRVSGTEQPMEKSFASNDSFHHEGE